MMWFAVKSGGLITLKNEMTGETLQFRENSEPPWLQRLPSRALIAIKNAKEVPVVNEEKIVTDEAIVPQETVEIFKEETTAQYHIFDYAGGSNYD